CVFGGSVCASRVKRRSHSPVARPRAMGRAIDCSSIARSPNERIPPIENVNSLSSGNASITRRVRRRCPCQCDRSASGEMKEAVTSDMESSSESSRARRFFSSRGDRADRSNWGVSRLSVRTEHVSRYLQHSIGLALPHDEIPASTPSSTARRLRHHRAVLADFIEDRLRSAYRLRCKFGVRCARIEESLPERLDALSALYGRDSGGE